MPTHSHPPADDTASTNKHIADLLQRDASDSHAAFTARLVPTVDAETILGVKMGPTRAVARTVLADDDLTARFLVATPHPFLEQNIVHILLLNTVKDIEQWQRQMEEFLPFVDNWMVTDAINPKTLKRATDKIIAVANQWIATPEPYIIRSGVILYLHALRHRAPTQRDLEMIASITYEDYYVEMAMAWYFATAYDRAPELLKPLIAAPSVADIEELADANSARTNPLSVSVRKRTIQKILESRKTTPTQRDWARSVREQLKK